MSKKTFKINNTLYPPEKVQDVINVFTDFQIVFHEATGALEITTDEDPQFIFDEFMNYLLVYLNE